jgi:hypothetical protein
MTIVLDMDLVFFTHKRDYCIKHGLGLFSHTNVTIVVDTDFIFFTHKCDYCVRHGP